LFFFHSSQRLIEFFPLWMAPNVITTLGLLISAVAHVLTMFYNWDFSAAMPLWVHVVVAVCMFVYQTLDNLDGRQARRTGTSSPLGLMFDHGVDSVLISFVGLSAFSCWRADPGVYLLTMYGVGISTFFFATWEQYFTGELWMGYVNGPTDGALISMALILTPVFMGTSYFFRFGIFIVFWNYFSIC
jgi:ethanolaminephosphotransferase